MPSGPSGRFGGVGMPGKPTLAASGGTPSGTAPVEGSSGSESPGSAPVMPRPAGSASEPMGFPSTVGTGALRTAAGTPRLTNAPSKATVTRVRRPCTAIRGRRCCSCSARWSMRSPPDSSRGAGSAETAVDVVGGAGILR